MNNEHLEEKVYDYNRCPKCNELLELGETVVFCGNEDCDVKDGVIMDEENLFGYGEGREFVNLDAYSDFVDEVRQRKSFAREREESTKRKYWKWKKRYYRTADYIYSKEIKERIDLLIAHIKLLWVSITDWLSSILSLFRDK